MYDVAIIGCGITGAALAFELSRYNIRTLVLEKENDVCCGASRANSGILHAGYDPKPGTLMAKLNVEGSALARQLCRELSVPCECCGSLVVAFSEDEISSLKGLYERGVANGVEGLALWDAAALRAAEPHISREAVAALYAPSAAVVIPWELTLALAETAAVNGSRIELESEVTAIERTARGYKLHTKSGDYESRFVVNAAGIYADRVHNMAAAPEFEIMPSRGEYYLLDKSAEGIVRHVIFQCPSKKGKGTLIAPTTHGNIVVGPNSENIEARNDTASTAEGLSFVRAQALKSVPALPLQYNIRNFSGIRAATDKNDFIIAEAQDAPGFFDLAGIKSPGLSAAPAIAKMALSLLAGAGLELEAKAAFKLREPPTRFSHLSAGEKRALVAERPEFGRVICRCEQVTEGEVLEALASPVPPLSVDAIKRRCGAGLGRCQGGFCGPRIVELLAEFRSQSPMEILQDTAGSFILTAETKGGGRHA